VIVDNQPAAGGLAALNHLVASDSEGLQFIIMNGGGAVLSQLFHLPTVQYDLAKVSILATVSSSPWLVLVAPNSPIRSMADIVKAGGLLRWPATGRLERYIEYQDPEATRTRIMGLLAEVTGERKEQLKTVAMKKYLLGG